jgi:predicted DNA-binding transcriptional regulator AlpA
LSESQTENLNGIFCLADWLPDSVHELGICVRFFLSESFGADHRHDNACLFLGLDRKDFAMADLPKVVTAKVAARFVGLSESTLAKLRLNGNGPVYCKLGRRVVYRPADLEQWLQSRTARDTSDADARFLKALTVAHPR